MPNLQIASTTDRIRYVTEDGVALSFRDVVVLIDSSSLYSLTLPPTADCISNNLYTLRCVAASGVTLNCAGADSIMLSGSIETSVVLSTTGEFIILRPWSGYWVEVWSNL